jgi:hypothetical protein
MKIAATPTVETCDVADGTGGKIPAHRLKALRLDTGEPEMTVFIGGDSGARAADYARARYTGKAHFVIHADPSATGIVPGQAEQVANGSSHQV